MIEITTVAQAVSIVAACWAIISGIGAWKREFIGKRQIELAEQVLANFFEICDAISFIRNPFSDDGEGSTRQQGDHETAEQTQLLNRGYIVVERYVKKESVFVEFNALKYRFMASFGAETEVIFVETNEVLNSIFLSARMLGMHYWQRQGRVQMEDHELKTHLDEMHRHQRIFWEMGNDTDEIRIKLKKVQDRLEIAVKPCFQEPVSKWRVLMKKVVLMVKYLVKLIFN